MLHHTQRTCTVQVKLTQVSLNCNLNALLELIFWQPAKNMSVESMIVYIHSQFIKATYLQYSIYMFELFQVVAGLCKLLLCRKWQTFELNLHVVMMQILQACNRVSIWNYNWWSNIIGCYKLCKKVLSLLHFVQFVWTYLWTCFGDEQETKYPPNSSLRWSFKLLYRDWSSE